MEAFFELLTRLLWVWIYCQAFLVAVTVVALLWAGWMAMFPRKRRPGPGRRL